MDDRDALLARVAALEADVARLKQRLEPESAAASAAPPPVAPPPVWSYQAAPPPDAESVTPAPPPPPRPTAAATEVLEARIGTRLLPLVGGGLFVLAFAFLVAYALQRGWIDLRNQMIGELVVSGAFSVMGLFQVRKREEFGQILTGIGSAGFYLSFAGGYAYKGLIDGNQLVAAFLVLSLLNIGYAAWRASPTFWGLGFAGGLVAACLPLSERKFDLHTSLLALVLLATGMLLIRNRWSVLALIQGIAVFTTTLAVSLDWPFPSGNPYSLGFYLLGLTFVSLTIFRYADAQTIRPPDGLRTFAALGAVAVVPLFLALAHGPQTGLVALGLTVAYAAAIVLLAQFGEAGPIQGVLRVTAVIIAAVFAPAWFLGIAEVAAYYSVTVLIGVVVAWLRQRDRFDGPFRSWISLLTGTTATLGLVGYLATFARAETLAPVQEFGLIAAGLLALAAVASTFAWPRSDVSSDLTSGPWGLTLLASSALVARALFLVLGPAGLAWPTEAATIASLVLAALGLALASAWNRDGTMALVSIVPFGAAGAVYVNVAAAPPQTYMTAQADLGLLALGGLLLLALGGTTWVLHEKDQRPLLADILLVAGAGLAARFIFVAFGPLGGLPNDAALPMSLLLSSVALLWLAARRSSAVTAAFGVFGVALAILAYVNEFLNGATVTVSPPMPLNLELIVVGMMLGSALVGAWAIRRQGAPLSAVQSVTAAILWPISSRFLVLVERAVGTDLPPAAVVSGSWALFAAIILVIGFGLKSMALRLVSLALFGVTATKIILNDLTELDPAIRIALLMAVGLVMLGMGYAYTRYQARIERAEVAGREEASR